MCVICRNCGNIIDFCEFASMFGQLLHPEDQYSYVDSCVNCKSGDINAN